MASKKNMLSALVLGGGGASDIIVSVYHSF